MKAVVITAYGPPDVFQIREVPKPTVTDDQVLVKVHASSINAADWRIMRANPAFGRMMFGLLKPKYTTIGGDLAGVVEAVGKNVTQFRPGDAVYGEIPVGESGSWSEYTATLEKYLAPKPANLSFEEAAAVPLAAVTALQGLRDHGQIQAGQKVLINGASGGVGTYAVQLAKHFGAEVTAVCSTRNLEMARSLGADHVIDYTKEDFTRSGKRYDLIYVANGYHWIFSYLRALNPGGTYVIGGGKMAQLFQAVTIGRLVSGRGGKKILVYVAHSASKDLLYLNGLLETGKLRPVIDHCYPMGQIVEAMRYFEDKHARGKVVITMEG